MRYAIKFWDFLSGKKTTLAAFAGLALSWAQAKGWISGEDAIYAASALTVLTGVAVGHKIQKGQ